MNQNLLKCLFSSVVITSLWACGGEVKDEEKKEEEMYNKVIYTVDFPFIQDETLLRWLPTEYSAVFNENQLFGEMNSKMNVICNRFYADSEEKVAFQTLENMSGKYRSELTENDVTGFINEMPEMMISEPVADTVILDVPCKIAMAEFKIDSVPPVKLYYTDHFNVKSPNWYNQYHTLDKFLMGYEVEQFGMRMKLMAKDVSQVSRKISSKDVLGQRNEADYDKMNPKQLRQEIKEMISDFME